eukprot:s4912_g1.t2
MSRLVAPKLLIPSLGLGPLGQGEPERDSAFSPAEFESAPSSRPSSNLASQNGNRPSHPRCDAHASRPIASIQSVSSRSDSKDSSLPLPLPFSRGPDPLHSTGSAESEVISQPDPISPSSALGGAISTFGAPAEWWHDSIILGRLSALALRYFATKAVKKPWKAWLRYLDAVRDKEEGRLRSQLQLALRLWRRRTVWHGRRLAPKRPLLLALQKITQTQLAPVWGRLRQAVFAQRDVERRLRVLHLIRRKMMETMAQVHYYQSLLRLGLAALWLAVKMRDTSSSSVALAPVVCSSRHTHVQQVLSRAWRRWRFATPSQESESIQQEERTALIGQDGTDQPQVVNRDADSSDDDALSTSRRCRFTTGMFLLCVAAAILIFYPDAMAHRHFSKTLVGLEEWEQIPNISGVIKRAEGLDPAKTPRNLRDLFTQYGPYQDGELPWIRTQCVVDAVQASAYLVQAVVFLYRAIDYQGLECPKDTPSGCAVSIAGFIASLSWVASYISLAASSCGDAVNSGALCAADWTALMADFAEVASSGAAVKNDCDFGGKISALLLHIDRNRKTHPYYHWEQFLPAGAGPAVIMARKRHMGTMRDFDITQCVVDVTNAAAFLVRATLQVSSHGNNRLACSIDILDVISSFSWISRFISLAVTDCSVGGSQKALCGAQVSNLVAAVARANNVKELTARLGYAANGPESLSKTRLGLMLEWSQRILHSSGRMWLSSAQYQERELEAWLTGECSTPRSMILAEAFESVPMAETEKLVSATAMSCPSPDTVRRHPFLAEGSTGLQVQAEEPLLLLDDQAMDVGVLGRQAWLQRSRKLSTAQRSRQLSQVSGKSSKGKDLDMHRRHSSEDSSAALAAPSVPDNRQQRTNSSASSDAEVDFNIWDGSRPAKTSAAPMALAGHTGPSAFSGERAVADRSDSYWAIRRTICRPSALGLRKPLTAPVDQQLHAASSTSGLDAIRDPCGVSDAVTAVHTDGSDDSSLGCELAG